jgi:G6PDH family F420-dependent oxidoreductase
MPGPLVTLAVNAPVFPFPTSSFTMTSFGYNISTEEHDPKAILHNARRAEEVGFTFAMISDHYHPWVSTQGNSPFVWSVIGGIAQATSRLILGTGVTCPIMRIHPAIVAQAAATSAAMMPGRFFLGVGTGENLNEHVLGLRWPPHDIRLAMLEEAISVIRLLFSGGTQSFWGNYFTVEDAQLFTLPELPVPIMVAASGPTTATTAGRIGDGLIGTRPDPETIERFVAGGGGDKPRLGKISVCWAPTEQAARRTVHRIWPNAGLRGELKAELRTVVHFEQAVEMVTEAMATEYVVCGPDPEQHIAAIRAYMDAGYDHIYFHQIGPDQEGFFRFYDREILPAVT